jgi:hypothetical protein
VVAYIFVKNGQTIVEVKTQVQWLRPVADTFEQLANIGKRNLT